MFFQRKIPALRKAASAASIFPSRYCAGRYCLQNPFPKGMYMGRFRSRLGRRLGRCFGCRGCRFLGSCFGRCRRRNRLLGRRLGCRRGGGGGERHCGCFCGRFGCFSFRGYLGRCCSRRLRGCGGCRGRRRLRVFFTTKEAQATSQRQNQCKYFFHSNSP